MPKAICAAIASLFLLHAAHGVGNAAEFSFVALGDMPYGKPEKAYPPYERLLAAINGAQPAFSIHIGDIKSGGTACSDEEFQNQLDFFNTLNAALIYTPGDNEWTDCHRKKAGAMDPLERLAKLREMFFKSGQSLGKQPMALTRQADVSAHAQIVENARWQFQGVTFATAHVVGSNNNFEARDARAVEEYFQRNDANIAWLNDAFDAAEQEASAAMVLAIHANVFIGADEGRWPGGNGFKDFVGAFVKRAEAFKKPILLIHGDSHTFRIDQPFKGSDGKAVLDNVTRLEVFGSKHVHAVQVHVNTDAGGVFSFQPILGPGNSTFIAQ